MCNSSTGFENWGTAIQCRCLLAFGGRAPCLTNPGHACCPPAHEAVGRPARVCGGGQGLQRGRSRHGLLKAFHQSRGGCVTPTCCPQSVRLRDVTLDLKSFAKHIDSCSQLGGGLVVSVNACVDISVRAICFLGFEYN